LAASRISSERRVLNGALSPNVSDEKAAVIALKLIETADPVQTATVEFGAKVTVDDVNTMSFSELMQLAARHGIEVPARANEGARELPHPS
jgi:hypothetical protein